MDLEKRKLIEYKGSRLTCTCELGESAKSELEFSEALGGTLTVSLKAERKPIKHVTYSMDEAEEKALYLLLRKRNERQQQR